jgi:hypothetical protein
MEEAFSRQILNQEPAFKFNKDAYPVGILASDALIVALSQNLSWTTSPSIPTSIDKKDESVTDTNLSRKGKEVVVGHKAQNLPYFTAAAQVR